MDPNWNDNQPIYRQLRDRMVALILEGALKEGDPLPSVRNVAADYRLNPLTVLKGYQQLVDEGLVEKRRGRGMFISDGARRQLMAGERRPTQPPHPLDPRVRAVLDQASLSTLIESRRGFGYRLRAIPRGTFEAAFTVSSATWADASKPVMV